MIASYSRPEVYHVGIICVFISVFTKIKGRLYIFIGLINQCIVIKGKLEFKNG